MASLISSSKRFDGLQKDSLVPGPGAYHEVYSSLKPKENTLPPFLNSEARFKEKKVNSFEE